MVFKHSAQSKSSCARGRRSTRFLSLKMGSHLMNRSKHTNNKVVPEPPSLLVEPWTSPTKVLSAVPSSCLPDKKNRVAYSKPLQGKEDNATTMDIDVGNQTTIRFEESVSVLEIPHHSEYDEDTRNRLWGSRVEKQLDRKRNWNEFVRETYYSHKYQTRSWWMCREEEDMIVHKGELLHPYTFYKVTGKEPKFLWYSRLRAKRFIAKREQAREKQRQASRWEDFVPSN